MGNPQSMQEAAFEFIRSCSTVEDAVHAFRSEYNVAHATYHLAQTAISRLDSMYVRTTYSPEWVSRYLQRNYIDIDPVLQEGVQRMLPFDWSEISMTKAAIPLFEDAVAHGLGTGGYSIPVIDKNYRRALFSINTFATGPGWAETVSAYKAEWADIAHIIHNMAMNEIFGANEQALHLSPREVQCLTWAARGKDHKEIATILGLSGHTVLGYLKSTRHKLGCVNIAQAIAEAIRFRIIDP